MGLLSGCDVLKMKEAEMVWEQEMLKEGSSGRTNGSFWRGDMEQSTGKVNILLWKMDGRAGFGVIFMLSAN